MNNLDIGQARMALSPPRDRGTTLIVAAGSWLPPAALLLVSVALFTLNTRHGINILVDSVRHFGLIEGPGDAPMYPWLLYVMSSPRLPIEQAAKLLGLVLVCCNTMLAWHLLLRATGRPNYAAFGTALIILSPQFVAFHAAAMTEPLFIFWVLVSIECCMQSWNTESRPWLVGCAVAIGLASLARFVGPPLGAAIAASLLLDSRRPLSRRIINTVILGLVSGSIFFAWSFLSQMLLGHSLGREMQFDGNLDARAWHASLNALAAWLSSRPVPEPARIALFCLTAGCSMILIAWQTRRVTRHPSTRPAPNGEAVASNLLPIMLALFLVFYLAFMWLAASIEANQSLTPRYALPIYVTSVVMVTVLVAKARQHHGSIRHIGTALATIATLVIAGHVVRTAERSRQIYLHGFGFEAPRWTQSATMLTLSRMPADTVIYSNGPDAIVYVLRRRANYLPMLELPRTGRPDPSAPFEKQVANIQMQRGVNNVAIVFFDAIDWRFYLPTETNIRRLLGLQLLAHEPDGRIYTLPKDSSGFANLRAASEAGVAGSRRPNAPPTASTEMRGH